MCLVLYSEAVDAAFRPHMPILTALHRKYCKFKSNVQQLKSSRMNVKEWLQMMGDASLFNEVRAQRSQAVHSELTLCVS